MKSFFKELAIILLLILGICLALGIAFYRFIPNTKVVPSDVEKYQTSESIKDEIDQTTVDYTNEAIQNVTFEITDSDLRLYKNSGSYTTGKSNPFVAESSDVTNTENTQGGSTPSNGGSTTTVTPDETGKNSGTK